MRKSGVELMKYVDFSALNVFETQRFGIILLVYYKLFITKQDI